MELESPRIAHDFEDQSSHQTGKETPGAISYIQEYLDEKQDSENGGVEGITAE